MDCSQLLRVIDDRIRVRAAPKNAAVAVARIIDVGELERTSGEDKAGIRCCEYLARASEGNCEEGRDGLRFGAIVGVEWRLKESSGRTPEIRWAMGHVVQRNLTCGSRCWGYRVVRKDAGQEHQNPHERGDDAIEDISAGTAAKA